MALRDSLTLLNIKKRMPVVLKCQLQFQGRHDPIQGLFGLFYNSSVIGDTYDHNPFLSGQLMICRSIPESNLKADFRGIVLVPMLYLPSP
jgi:hypothetical protein